MAVGHLLLLHRARLPLVEEEEDEHEVHDQPGDAEPGGERIRLGERFRHDPTILAQLVHLPGLRLRILLLRRDWVQQVTAGGADWKRIL